MSDNKQYGTELPDEIKDALGSLLNMAVQVAEMQLDSDSNDAIYGICDTIADFFDLPVTFFETEEHEDGTIIGRVVEKKNNVKPIKPNLTVVVKNDNNEPLPPAG